MVLPMTHEDGVLKMTHPDELGPQSHGEESDLWGDYFFVAYNKATL